MAWWARSLEKDAHPVAVVVDREQGSGPALGERLPDQIGIRAGEAGDLVEREPAHSERDAEIDDSSAAVGDLDPERGRRRRAARALRAL